MYSGYVYIMSNIARTTLYIGVTNDLNRRVWEHREGEGSKFTSKYNLSVLLYAEQCPTMPDAIKREKQLKNWKREWKWDLIKTLNPELIDLYPTLRG